ncbi:MAG: hypothetical protein NVSMB57_13540 [Actinomycetota bacterium]
MAAEVVSIRAVQADANHDHVDLVGYHSSHIAQEPIMLSIPRTLQRIALGERFYIKDGDVETDIVAGSCPVCDIQPYLRTKADSGDEQKLLLLPQG